MSLFKGVSTTTRADKISNFQSTSCEFGTPLPIAYGTCKLAPNLINHQDFTTSESKTVTKSGKSKSTTIDYKYNVYVELALCEGTIGGIGKVWVGDNVYATRETFNATNDAVGAPLTLNDGSVNTATTWMSTRHADIACGYNNMAFLYGYVYLGTNTASIPSYQVEVKGLLRDTGDNTDANPADVIIDLLGRIGLSSYVDDNSQNKYDTSYSFGNYRKYCEETGLLISTPGDEFSSQKKCSDVIQEILNLTQAYMFWSVDKFKIVPRDDRSHGDWTPNTTIMYDLTSEDMAKQSDGAAMVSFKRKDSSEIYNRFGLTFTNRSNDYEDETVFFEDTASITANGVKANSTINGKWFHTKERAIKAVELAARMNNTEVVEYQFVLDWAFERLEPGDLVTLTDDAIGLSQQPVMIKSITFDTLGRPTVTAVRREPGSYSSAIFDVHENDYNYINHNVQPSNTKAPIFIHPPAELVTAASGVEVWLALQGEDANWGGCQVMISDKESNYSYHGVQNSSSVMGTCRDTLWRVGANVIYCYLDNVNTPDIVLSATAEEAEAGKALLWFGGKNGGEFVGYETATKQTEEKLWRFGGLHHGLFGTECVIHPAGSPMCVVDSNLYSVQLPLQYNNTTMHFKFPAFNVLQQNVQSLSDVTDYSEVVSADSSVTPNGPTNFALTFTDVITASWTAPSNAVVSYYEVRSSAGTDSDSNILYKGSVASGKITLGSRTGTLYLYAVGLSGARSTVVSLTYNKATPAAPTFTATAGLHNITLTYSSKPANCYAIRYSIVGATHSYEITTSDTSKLITVEPDVYTVTGKWVDVFGVGTGADKEVTVALLIDSSWVHVSENTVFDNNVIVSNMIQAGAVTAAKMSVNSLSAITATVGHIRTASSGARIEIGRNTSYPNLLEVFDANGKIRVKLGAW